MTVRGWLILGNSTTLGSTLPQEMYVGDTVGALPSAANFKVGQWMYWRPVAAILAGMSTQMVVVCIEVPL